MAPSGFKYKPKGGTWSMASGGPFTTFQHQFAPPESDTYQGVTSALIVVGFTGSGKDYMTMDILKKRVSQPGTESLVTMFPYPNPSRDGQLTIRYVTSRPLYEPSVEIYTLTGDPVATVNATLRGDLTQDLYFPFEAKWDGRVADGTEAGPGLYLFRALASDTVSDPDKKLQTAVGKFAIIR